jgi:hypothetical protein
MLETIFFQKSRRLWENVEKYHKPVLSQMTVQNDACALHIGWLKLHTRTHNCFTTYANARQCHIYTYIACLVFFFVPGNNSPLSAYFVRFIEAHSCLRFSCSIHLSSEECDKYRLAPNPCILFYLMKGYRLICVRNNADRSYF